MPTAVHGHWLRLSGGASKVVHGGLPFAAAGLSNLNTASREGLMALAHEDLRRAIVHTCREMNRLGINQGTAGNVSARIPGGFLLTPSGVPYDAMTPEQIVPMDLGGGYVGPTVPSSEWRMHLDIYRHRPEAEAIVHTHSTYATAFSCLRQDMPAFHYMIAAVGGPTLRCARYATFGTTELSAAMLEALVDRSACLLANHGVIVFGETLARALWRAGEVETLAKQYFVARQMGEPVILDEAEMQRVLTRFKTYGQQAEALRDVGGPALERPVRRDA